MRDNLVKGKRKNRSAKVLRSMNRAIDALYYLDESLLELGLPSDTEKSIEKFHLREYAEGLRQMRNIIFGDNINWKKLEKRL